MSDKPILFNAHALPVDNKEPHAQVGNHLRVNTHPLLGLPVAPFIVWRGVLDNIKSLQTRNNVVFRDKNGVLEPPFDVTPDNPVTAVIILKRGESCIWAQVDAQPLANLKPGDSKPALTIPDRIRTFSPILSARVRGSLTTRSPVLAVQPARTQPARRGSITSARLGAFVRSRAGRSAITARPVIGGATTGRPVVGSGRRPPRITPGIIDPGLIDPGLIDPGLFDPGLFDPGDLIPLPVPGKTDQLICEAFMRSIFGLASIGTRSKPRYAFSAPGIVEIKISGAGRVGGVRWVEADDSQRVKYVPYTIMNLPHKGGARYLPVDHARDFALERVKKQSSKRMPLQETVGAPAPNAAGIWDSSREQERVDSLTETLDKDLESLINNTAVLPLDQQIVETIKDENNKEIGESTIDRISRVFQAQADPGTASLLGYKTLDDDWRETEERIVFYKVAGYFRDFPVKDIFRDWVVDSQIARIPVKQRNLSKKDLIGLISVQLRQFQSVKITPDIQKVFESFESKDEYFALNCTAIADRGAPLDGVLPPVITGTEHISWSPGVPPAAKRVVEINLAQVRIAGLLAAGKRAPASGSGTYRPLNRANDKNYHLPVVLGLSTDAESREIISQPGIGFISDRQAEASNIRYFIAQQDRFGRWSNWRARVAAPGPRPNPPRPDFQAFYTQPSIEDAALQGGEVYVKIAVPDKESLAPGSYLLDRLRLKVFEIVDGIAVPATTNFYHVNEAEKFFEEEDVDTFFVKINFNGPILQPTEQRRLHITAFWINTQNILSVESEAQRLLITDPRPPAQVVLPDQLQYAARPDVTGLSWVEYRWTPASGQNNFGIYYSDENRVRAYLEDEGETTLLESLDNAANAAARATLYRSIENIIPDYLFERLRDVNVSFSSGDKGFRHGVSGSLRILSFYKVAAEAATGAKPVLQELPILVYGVPNSDAPSRPTLVVTPDEPVGMDPDYVAKVSITLDPGVTPGETWRLRRSSVESYSAWKMPIVDIGPLSSIDEGNGLQVADVRDTGPVQISASAILKPWVRYSWVAEVQGAPESGSVEAGQIVPGRWSKASDPVSLILLPDSPPQAVSVDGVSSVAVADGFGDVEITLNHPDALDGGAVGNYTLRVMRRNSANSVLTILREQTLTGSGPFTVSGLVDDDPAEAVPEDTEYLLELIDPLGRASETTSVLVN